jgi:hypothetical protein
MLRPSTEAMTFKHQPLLPVVVGLVDVAGGVVGVGACLVELSIGVVDLAEAVQDLSFAGLVTGGAADRESLLMVIDGLKALVGLGVRLTLHMPSGVIGG